MTYPPNSGEENHPHQAQPPVAYVPARQQQPSAAAIHALDYAVARHVQVGWAVESRTETMAVLVSGGSVNHVLHLLLTLLTCGFWAVVWFAMAVMSGQRRVTLVLNHDGTISSTGG
jgi:hypothetical protein